MQFLRYLPMHCIFVRPKFWALHKSWFFSENTCLHIVGHLSRKAERLKTDAGSRKDSNRHIAKDASFSQMNLQFVIGVWYCLSICSSASKITIVKTNNRRVTPLPFKGCQFLESIQGVHCSRGQTESIHRTLICGSPKIIRVIPQGKVPFVEQQKMATRTSCRNYICFDKRHSQTV